MEALAATARAVAPSCGHSQAAARRRLFRRGLRQTGSAGPEATAEPGPATAVTAAMAATAVTVVTAATVDTAATVLPARAMSAATARAVSPSSKWSTIRPALRRAVSSRPTRSRSRRPASAGRAAMADRPAIPIRPAVMGRTAATPLPAARSFRPRAAKSASFRVVLSPHRRGVVISASGSTRHTTATPPSVALRSSTADGPVWCSPWTRGPTRLRARSWSAPARRCRSWQMQPAARGRAAARLLSAARSSPISMAN